MSGLRVVILSRSARAADSPAWGLGADAKLVEQMLRIGNSAGTYRISSIDHIDPTSFYGSPRKPQAVDLQIHLEVPCRAAWSWASYNIVVVNPEWWPRTAWNWALAKADLVVFKSEHARRLFPEVEGVRARVIHWRAGETPTVPKTRKREFLYLIGASANKLAAAKVIVGTWKSSWPTLRVVGTQAVLDALPVARAENVMLSTPYASDKERWAAQAECAYHIVGSAAEGFGYTFAEAAALGACPLWTSIPVYQEYWGAAMGIIGRITVANCADGEYRDRACSLRADDVVAGVESLLAADADAVGDALKRAYGEHFREFRESWRKVLSAVPLRVKKQPAPKLPPARVADGDLPVVGIITLTHNRPRWFHNMARNVLLADYPIEKLRWIVVDDSTEGRVDSDIMKFQESNPHVRVNYISLTKKLSVGEKRNRGCAAAPDASVFVMMDDDDHYPKQSILARISWLRSAGSECVYCSTIPMYHTQKYISAMNVPPLDLAPEERVSEASLCFTRDFWLARKFADISVAEGEAFLTGRMEKTLEIPPEGVIVSFLHGGNSTSRRVPAESEPNGCHYGFSDEYFSYLCGL
jgi:hypothetical protein